MTTCAGCRTPRRNTVSLRFCDDCLGALLADSRRGVERWYPHPGSGALVSNLGRVRGVRGEVLKATPNGKGGYPTVTVAKRQRRAHHLVLETYVGPRPPDCQACHYDDDPLNNRLFNVRWDWREGNEDDRRRNRLVAEVSPDMESVLSSGQSA